MSKSKSSPKENQLILSGNESRRIQARAEMCLRSGIGAIKYLANSEFVRKGYLSDGRKGYSAVDLINVLAESQNEPRNIWDKTKARLIRDDKDMSQEMGHISLPLWDDKYGRSRATDALTWHGVKILIFELHSELSNRLRHEILREWEHHSDEHREAIFAELDRESGWAGTLNRLLMAEIFEEGDYDKPIQPPGCPE